MKGKIGNLIINRKPGESIQVDGPAKITFKKIKKGKVVLLINPNEETNVIRGPKEVTEKQNSVDD